jgi:hypothetical protein
VANTIIETLAWAMLIGCYATGCAATIIEIHRQSKTETTLRRILEQKPSWVNIPFIVLVTVLWPLAVTWRLVRATWGGPRS